MISGSCLCGNVKYLIEGQIESAAHCHCITSRKAHRAAFSTVAAVKIQADPYLFILAQWLKDDRVEAVSTLKLTDEASNCPTLESLLQFGRLLIPTEEM